MLKIFFKIFYCLKIKGIENIPKNGPFIIAANHASFYDPTVIVAAVPHKVYWVIRKDLYNIPILNKIFRFAGFVGINGASKEALDILRRAKVLGIFPEGTRSCDGKIRCAKSGTALLAMQADVRVIPCAIKGAYDVYPPDKILPRLGKIEIIFGKPICFKRLSMNHIPNDTLKSATETIMNNIKDLLSK